MPKQHTPTVVVSLGVAQAIRLEYLPDHKELVLTVSDENDIARIRLDIDEVRDITGWLEQYVLGEL